MEASSSSGRIGGKWPGQALSGRRTWDRGGGGRRRAGRRAAVRVRAAVQQEQHPAAAVVSPTQLGGPRDRLHPDGHAGQPGGGRRRPAARHRRKQPGVGRCDHRLLADRRGGGDQEHLSRRADRGLGLQRRRRYARPVSRPGQRAIEIPIDATHGLQGYVLPGDRVDLLTSAASRATGGEVPLAPNIRCSAVGTGVNGTAVGYRQREPRAGGQRRDWRRRSPMPLTAARSGSFCVPPVWSQAAQAHA